MGLCVSLLGNPGQAEDAAQEVFIKTYRALGQFRGDSSFSTWLYRIAVNHCRDIQRKKTRQKTESWEGLIERHGPILEKLFQDPQNQILLAEASDLTGRVLAALPEEYRAVLVLRETQGLSYQEIAQTLDITSDAVKARLRRARAELSDKLKPFIKDTF